jgi:prepilin-type N-terminal cleavage/methylation domain-containing protein
VHRPQSRTGARRQDGVTLMELLVAMSILAVITAMILVSWFALQKSFAQTSRASQSREFARDAVQRMTQEIRDAQGSDQGTAITEAGRWEIVFYSTYNMAGNATTGSAPRQTAFTYIAPTSTTSGKVYRVVDTNNNGVSDELADPEQYGRIVVDNVINQDENRSLFRYWYYTSAGTYTIASSVANTETTNIRAVQIRVLVDLNPGKSPVYMDLKTTAQPRNMRPAT